MQKGIDSYLREQFDITDVDIRTYSPLTLAYIGDGIFDLIIRSLVVAKGNARAGQLHRRTSQIVKAKTQAEIIESIIPLLTEEEEFAYKLGRNHRISGKPKHASVSEYSRATGLEAIFGYLHLTGNNERIQTLIHAAYDDIFSDLKYKI